MAACVLEGTTLELRNDGSCIKSPSTAQHGVWTRDPSAAEEARQKQKLEQTRGLQYAMPLGERRQLTFHPKRRTAGETEKGPASVGSRCCVFKIRSTA